MMKRGNLSLSINPNGLKCESYYQKQLRFGQDSPNSINIKLPDTHIFLESLSKKLFKYWPAPPF